MNIDEAKFILNASRSNESTESDPKLAEARRELETNPELARWFDSLQQFDRDIASKLQSIPMPEGLVERIRAGHAVSRIPVPWHRRFALAWAAAFLVLAVGAGLFFLSRPSRSPQTFAAFRQDMVRFMDEKWDRTFDLADRDFSKLQSWLEAKAPALKLQVSSILEASRTYGCKSFAWHGATATLVCFVPDTTGQVVHVLAVDRSVILDDPGSAPLSARVGEWNTSTWSRDGKVYVALTTASGDALAKCL